MSAVDPELAAERERALDSFDPGHPLSDMVGRMIKATAAEKEEEEAALARYAAAQAESKRLGGVTVDASSRELLTSVDLTDAQESTIDAMVAASITPLPRYTLRRVMDSATAGELIGSRVPALEDTAQLRNGGLWTDEETGQPVLAIFPCLELPALRAAVLSAQPAFGANTPRLQMGFSNLSVTFGYRPKKPLLGQEGCVLTAFNRDYPDAATFLGYYSEVLAKQVAAAFPEIEVMGREQIDRVLPDWRLSKSSLWTSGVINKESALPYHRDRNNFDAWSVMPVIRKGVRGGFLHIPEYGITVPTRDGFAVAFYGKGLVHGVTPMQKLRDTSYRISVVYYALQGLKDCHTYAEETARARAKRSAREDAMAARPALTPEERMSLPRAHIAKDGDGIGFNERRPGERRDLPGLPVELEQHPNAQLVDDGEGDDVR